MLASVASLISDGIIITDSALDPPGPTIVYVNEAVLRQSGFARDELIGASPRIFQGHGTDPAALARIGTALRAGESIREELVNYRKDGTECIVELEITPATASDGSRSGFVAIQRDVTVSRSADRRFRALVEHSSDLLSVNEPNGVVSYVSPSIRALLGWEPEDVVGHYGAEFVHPDDLVTIADGLTVKAAASGTYPAVEFRFRHADGSWHWLEAVTTNLLGDPAIAGMVVNARDITERKLLEAQLHQTTRTEALGRIAGSVAHEFNNLLTVINGYAELLNDGTDHPSVTGDRVACIAAAGRRAAALTAQLLAFSRSQHLEPRTIDVNAVAIETCRLLSVTLADFIELKLDLDPEPCWVEMDPNQLGQVIMNLGLNGRDAIAREGVLTITTRCVGVDAPGSALQGQVVIEVADTGVGIPPADCERVFDPFFSTKTGSHGTGLGLPFVSSAVAAAGGVISLRSEPGTGSVFQITLPSTAECTGHELAVDAPTKRPREGRVLVIDNDAFVAELAAQMLQRSGWSTQIAKGPMSLVDTSECDVILCDVHVSILSGPDAESKLHLQRPELRVVYMTTRATDVDSNDRLIDSDELILHKPFTLAELTAVMDVAFKDSGP